MLIVVSLKDLVILIRRVRVIVFSATFNNIAVIIVVVSFICGGTRSSRKKEHRPAASYWRLSRTTKFRLTEKLFQCKVTILVRHQTLKKSLGETNILLFNKIFNSLSLCFVYLVLFCVLGVALCTWCCFVYLVSFCVLGVVLCTWCCFVYLVLFCVLGVVLCTWCCFVYLVLFYKPF